MIFVNVFYKYLLKIAYILYVHNSA